MSEEDSDELGALTAALRAAELETVEAYDQSDWRRVWELTNDEIPKLERAIAILNGLETEDNPIASAEPLDFDWMSIELAETKNSLFNTYMRRQASVLKQVKVSVVFSQSQIAVIEKTSLDNTVFYDSTSDLKIKVVDLIRGPWISRPMAEQDADITAGNARDGINDLRLIIQSRARRGRR